MTNPTVQPTAAASGTRIQNAVAVVLQRHQRQPTGGCHCGGDGRDYVWTDHVARMLYEAGLLCVSAD